jgi:hypothetical protein
MYAATKQSPHVFAQTFCWSKFPIDYQSNSKFCLWLEMMVGGLTVFGETHQRAAQHSVGSRQPVNDERK